MKRAKVPHPDKHVCMSLDGARVHMDPNASPETVAALRDLIAAVKRNYAKLARGARKER